MALLNPSQNYKFPFSKYSGAGNDFILIDDRTRFFPIDNQNFIQRLCHRQCGIGADGIVLLQDSTTHADFRFRIFNADGSEAEMCGNGVRCLGKFIQELGFNKSEFTLQTMERILSVAVSSQEVTVDMGLPKDMKWNITVPLHSEDFLLHFLNTGVPHAVLFVKNVSHIDVQKIGKEIRFHPLFKPNGTNVNFVHINNNELHIRTYERGVEAETLACGTGTTAAALAAHFIHGLPSPIKVHTQSKEVLTISFATKQRQFHQVSMSGNAHRIFQGVY